MGGKTLAGWEQHNGRQCWQLAKCTTVETHHRLVLTTYRKRRGDSGRAFAMADESESGRTDRRMNQSPGVRTPAGGFTLRDDGGPGLRRVRESGPCGVHADTRRCARMRLYPEFPW